MKKIIKQMFKGFLMMLTAFMVAGAVLAVLIGPAIIVSYFENIWLTLLYIPHFLGFLYLAGEE